MDVFETPIPGGLRWLMWAACRKEAGLVRFQPYHLEYISDSSMGYIFSTHCETWEPISPPACLSADLLDWPPFVPEGIVSGQIAGLMQLNGSYACLYESNNALVWGGTTTDGQFQCNNAADTYGSASNTFTTFFAGRC